MVQNSYGKANYGFKQARVPGERISTVNQHVVRNPSNNKYTDYAARKKAYGHRIGTLSKRYNLPYELCLAIGPEDDAYPVFIQLTVDVKRFMDEKTHSMLSQQKYHKIGLKRFLGYETYNLMGIDKRKTDFYSLRLADYILKAYDQQTKGKIE